MAIEFRNIKTNERRTLEDPNQIGAFINSSDLHINSNLGQDFGWRLAPEVVRRVERMRQDSDLLEKLSSRMGIGVEDITTIHLVNQISHEEGLKKATEQYEESSTGKYQDEYERELAELRKKDEEAARAKAQKKRDEAKKQDDKKASSKK